MAESYHVNLETGRVNICRASTRACPLGGEHFSSKVEAHRHKEQLLEQEQTSPQWLRKAPAPSMVSADKLAAFKDHLASVFPNGAYRPSMSSEYKRERSQKQFSSEAFQLIGAGDEAVVFRVADGGLVLKVLMAHNSSETAALPTKIKVNSAFNEKQKGKLHRCEDSSYRLAKTEFIESGGLFIIAQEDLSQLPTGHISARDGQALNRLGFEDLRNENTAREADGVVVLFDCYPL